MTPSSVAPQRPRTDTRMVASAAAHAPAAASAISELEHFIDSDPRLQLATVDGRWLDPFSGQAVPAPDGIRQAAWRHLTQMADWRQRRCMGMSALAVCKHYHDLQVFIPQDERLRIRDRASSMWLNPYAGQWEPSIRLPAGEPISAEHRLLIARALARTPHIQGALPDLARLLSAEREVLPAEVSAQPASAAPATGVTSRTASAVFRRMPTIAGWDFVVHADSYQTVGGDFYEVHPLADDRVLVALGDVSGHGMQGARAATALLKCLRKSLHLAGDIPGLVASLNQSCCEFLHKGQFITLFLGVLKTSDGSGQFAALGHHRPLQISPGKRILVRELGAPSMALGLVTGAVFTQRLQVEDFQLAHGDYLLQCSDGILESRPPECEELFGFNRYAGTALAHADDGAQALVDGVAASAQQYAGGTLDDDCTVLAVRRLAPQHSR